MGEDDTSRIRPEETLMTKNPGEPNTSTSSVFDTSFHQLPEGDVPLYQEAERVQWHEWVRLVIQGHHCLDNAQGLVRTDAPTLHRTAVSVFLQLVSSMGWCRSLRGVDVSCASLRGKPREVKDPLFFEPPSRGLPGRERSLDRDRERCFWIARFSPWMVERTA